VAQDYRFGKTDFATHVWLDGGAFFRNPDFLEIEMTIAGKFGVEVQRADGTIACAAQRANANAGWHTFHFRDGGECGAGVPNGDYKIRLVNHDAGSRSAKAGRLVYDV